MQTVLDDKLAASLVAEQQRDAAFHATLEALISGEIPVVLHFQPIVDLKRGVVTGYESLARFPRELGPAPDICFAAASLVGRSLALEEVTVRAAFAGRDLLPHDCFLTINVTPAFLLSEHWQRALARRGSLDGITIEITEQESIRDYDAVRERTAQVRAAGGYVAVDDACSGYASLQHVLEIHPSFIKLDRSLIRDCDNNRAKSALIEMMGRTANRLDAWVIAEGIETAGELDELIRLEVPLGQGYFLGRPNAIMQPLPGATAEYIRAHAAVQMRRDLLLPYVESCVTRPTDEAAHVLLSTLTTDTVVVTDLWDRPMRIVERHPLMGRRSVRDIMKVQVASDPSEVLRRALTRPAASRFDPFAAIDAQGQLQGIVRVDRLMSAVLDPLSD